MSWEGQSLIALVVCLVVGVLLVWAGAEVAGWVVIFLGVLPIPAFLYRLDADRRFREQQRRRTGDDE